MDEDRLPRTWAEFWPFFKKLDTSGKAKIILFLLVVALCAAIIITGIVL